MAPQLVRYLRSLGADAHTAEDVVQETALRALVRKVEFVDCEDLGRWATVVARNHLIDLERKNARLVYEEPPEQASPSDVESAVMLQMAAETIKRAISTMHSRDQSALLTSHSRAAPADRSEARRNAVARFRARARLAAMVESAFSISGWL